jgi:CheY-like chemotaxis protein
MSKVLVVDDDANNRLLLSALLKHDHHTVIEATNGAQGLASVAEQIPDLVIVDLNMPEIDGVTFVRRVRENSDFRHVKIALSTGTSMTDAMQDFLDLYDVKTVIPKPSEPEQILRLIRSLLPV